MENLIIVEGVSKHYGNSQVLKDVSVNFEEKKIHGLVGRNGSGKTMLLKCICGFVPVSSGTITVRGKRIGKDVDVPSDIGIIIEAPGFLPNMSGYRNLKILAMVKQTIGKQEILAAMKRLNIDYAARKWVGKYSLGMRQRLGITQAIMEKPSLIILDEPMNGLDRQGVEDIRKLLASLREEGCTILLASHSTEDIDMLCDDVFEMDGGSLQQVR